MHPGPPPQAAAAIATNDAQDGAALRYLALGDSYTVGEGVPAHGRWTHQLAALLRAEGVALGEPHTIAATGWTTDELDAAIDADPPAGAHAFVTLLIGVNDQYRGRAVDDYAPRFEGLLHRAIGFAGGRPERVLALSIPDWGATSFGRASGRDLAQVARELDAYNAAARHACTRRGVVFVDITGDSRAHAGAGMEAGDGLHPSVALYARWARLALPAARDALGGPAAAAPG